MKKLLWLDDCRNPFENDWLNFSPIGKDVEVIWCKTYDEFVNTILNNGLPNAICFDHDLGEEKSGMDCVKWLVEFCYETKNFIPSYSIQSANPVGKENIDKLLKNYIEKVELNGGY